MDFDRKPADIECCAGEARGQRTGEYVLDNPDRDLYYEIVNDPVNTFLFCTV